MAASITIHLKKVRFLFGVKGIHVMLEGEERADLAFGEAITVPTQPGPVRVQVVLKGGMKRYSNTLWLELAEDEEAMIAAEYSRMSGTIEIKQT